MKLKLSTLVVVAGLTPVAAFGFGIRGNVMGNGGTSSTPASNGVFRLYGTAGQPATGRGSNGTWQECSGFWCFGGSRVLAVDPGNPGALPLEFALGAAVPNPSRGQSSFDLALPKGGVVTLTAYDVGGRRIGDVVSHKFEAGQHQLTWRAPMARAGVYFVQVELDGVLKARRTIVLVR